MDYWATTGGLALGIPIPFALAGIVQLTRWRAAKLAQPIPNADDVDQDALRKQRQAIMASKGNKTKLVGLVVAFSFYMATLINMERFPNWFKLTFWAGLAGTLTTFHVASGLAQLTGVMSSGLSRYSNKMLRYKNIIDNRGGLVTILVSSIFVVGLASSIPFLFPGNTTLYMLAFFFFASTIPYRVMTNITVTSNTSAALKWRLFGLAAFVIGTLGLFTLVWGITAAFVLAFPGKGSEPSKTPKEPEDPVYLETLMKIMIHSFFGLQFCTLFGNVGAMLMPIYRVDWILSNQQQRGGEVRLEDDAAIEQERLIFSETRSIGTLVSDEIDKKDMGDLVVVPSLPQLLASGQIKHFLARPVYTATAMITIQMTMFGCTLMGKRLVEVLGIAEFDFHGLGETTTAIGSNFAALALVPFTLTPVLAIVSGLRGHSSLLFNHRADWSVHGSGKDESRPLLEDDNEDEKVELAKKDSVVVDA